MADKTFSLPVQRQVLAGNVVRLRYAEGRLEAGSFTQSVILGAGLDSFIWRRTDLAGRINVYEVDHPVSQAWKRERIDALALPVGETHTFGRSTSKWLRSRMDWAWPDSTGRIRQCSRGWP